MTYSSRQEPALQSLDEYNQSLMAQVYPPDGVKLQPADRDDWVYELSPS